MEIRPERGGFCRPFGLGTFIRAFLMGEDTYGKAVDDPRRGAAIVDIKAAYKGALLREHAEDMVAMALEKGIDLSVEEALRRIPHRLTSIRSHSFYRYFRNLEALAWVERTGEEEPSLIGGVPGATLEQASKDTVLVEVPQPRRFYRLTEKGRAASLAAWSDPLQALYHYSPSQRSRKRPERRLAKPGSLPRTIRIKEAPPQP